MRSSLGSFPCEDAWSSVAVADALPAVCLRRVCTRVEAGERGAWKRVITSLTPAYRSALSGGYMYYGWWLRILTSLNRPFNALNMVTERRVSLFQIPLNFAGEICTYNGVRDVC